MRRLLITIWSQKSLLLLGVPLLMVIGIVLARPQAGPEEVKAAHKTPAVPTTTAATTEAAAGGTPAATDTPASGDFSDGTGSETGSGSSGSGGSGSGGGSSAVPIVNTPGVPTSLPPTTLPANVAGNGEQPPNAVSESPVAALIPVSFILVGGVVFVAVSRRRSRRSASEVSS